MKKAVILGASSGIGKELAFILATSNYEVWLIARRIELLKQVSENIPTAAHVQEMDVKNLDQSIDQFKNLLEDIGKVDLVIISSGVGHINHSLNWAPEKETIDTNILGFTAMAGIAIKHFIHHNFGHLVGISSIASIRGDNTGPAYSASKAFQSNYLEGLSKKMVKEHLNIFVTDISPGFVDTEMAKGEGLFWVASPQKAAKQIYRAIKNKKRKVYITKRWALIAFILKILPFSIYKKNLTIRSSRR